MTDKTTAINDVLATYRSRMAAIEARVCPKLHYVLSWGDGRYARLHEGEINITGFEHATFWGDRAAAESWIKKGLTDGRGQRPHAIIAFNAKQGAIITLQKVIDMVEGQKLVIDGEAL